MIQVNIYVKYGAFDLYMIIKIKLKKIFDKY